MDKNQILEKLRTGEPSKEKIIGWITALPNVTAKRAPIAYKVGDVMMHTVFQHPYVLLEKKKNYWVCGLLTSEENCPEILEKCNSRFFSENFLTKTLFTVTEVQGSFVNNYDNNRHLKSVLIKLRDCLK